MHDNFCRVHQTLRVTPAMEAGLADHVWSVEEVVARAPKAPTKGAQAQPLDFAGDDEEQPF
jgi:hypothetical protein